MRPEGGGEAISCGAGLEPQAAERKPERGGTRWVGYEKPCLAQRQILQMVGDTGIEPVTPAV